MKHKISIKKNIERFFDHEKFDNRNVYQILNVRSSSLNKLMLRDFWYSYIHRKSDVFIKKTSSHSLIECLTRSHAAIVWSTFFEQQITKKNQLSNQQRRHFLCLSDRAWNEKKKKKVANEWEKNENEWEKKKKSIQAL